MEDNRWTRAVLFATSNMDEIYFQDVFRTSVVMLLILVHFQISFSVIFLRLQVCPLHWLVYRDLDRPAFTGAVGVTLLLTHRRCCSRKNLTVLMISTWKTQSEIPCFGFSNFTSSGNYEHVTIFLVGVPHGHSDKTTPFPAFCVSSNMHTYIHTYTHTHTHTHTYTNYSLENMLQLSYSCKENHI
jgi:hypothetical protein